MLADIDRIGQGHRAFVLNCSRTWFRVKTGSDASSTSPTFAYQSAASKMPTCNRVVQEVAQLSGLPAFAHFALPVSIAISSMTLI